MPTLTAVKIHLKGCDDDTYVTVRVSPSLVIALQEIALRTQEASEDRCMPTMHVEEEPK